MNEREREIQVLQDKLVTEVMDFQMSMEKLTERIQEKLKALMESYDRQGKEKV